MTQQAAAESFSGGFLQVCKHWPLKTAVSLTDRWKHLVLWLPILHLFPALRTRNKKEAKKNFRNNCTFLRCISFIQICLKTWSSMPWTQTASHWICKRLRLERQREDRMEGRKQNARYIILGEIENQLWARKEKKTFLQSS